MLSVPYWEYFHIGTFFFCTDRSTCLCVDEKRANKTYAEDDANDVSIPPCHERKPLIRELHSAISWKIGVGIILTNWDVTSEENHCCRDFKMYFNDAFCVTRQEQSSSIKVENRPISLGEKKIFFFLLWVELSFKVCDFLLSIIERIT